MSRHDYVVYRGQSIKGSMNLLSFGEFEIDSLESARVEQLVSEAPIDSTYDGFQQMLRAVSEIRFPGYGYMSNRGEPQADGSILVSLAVEIPNAGKERYLVFRGRKDLYTLIDDFVGSSDIGNPQVTEENGQLIFRNLRGERQLARPLIPRK
jgi:hypothetical protein